MAATVKRDDIILLLGAGASVEADIPDSNKMIREIEKLILEDSDWKSYKNLYYYIRSSVYYVDGLHGIFGDNVPFNIERLVNVLEELAEKERHTLYPFVGTWNLKLLEVAGNEFKNILEFRDDIIKILRDKWVALPERESADYYSGLLRFQQEYGYPLRIFSLNYDLCVEENCGRENVQRGFPMGERKWDWRSFDETSEDPAPLMLYKLHGSLDWSMENGEVRFLDATSGISAEKGALIFGISYKLQYVDPFLYLAYELRRWTLDSARVIVCVGYGFNDDHINGILQQSLRQDQTRKLLAVVGPGDDTTASNEKNRVSQQLEASKDQIEVKAIGAKEFLESYLTIDSLSDLFPDEEELFPELEDSP